MSLRVISDKELSAEQKNIIDLPIEGTYIIKGGPGTGKSILAVKRIEKLVNEGQIVLSLVYNRPLMLYTKKALETYTLCNSMTYHQWLRYFYQKAFKKNTYPKDPYKMDGFTPDWKTIHQDCARFSKMYQNIIIDEAQDFPVELIVLLRKLSRNMMCFIDPEQAVTVNPLPVEKLTEIIKPTQIFELKGNYRNPVNIQNLASLYSNHPCSSNDVRKMKSVFTFIRSGKIEDQNKYIADICRQHKGKTIGIIVNNTCLKQLYNNLSLCLKGEGMHIQMHEFGGYDINFDLDGIFLLTYQTVKGLEFDVVILPNFDAIRSSGHPDIDKNRIYTAITRARKEIYISYLKTTNGKDAMESFRPVRNILQGM